MWHVTRHGAHRYRRYDPDAPLPGGVALLTALALVIACATALVLVRG